MNTWDKKDINIQVAQSVNLAVQELLAISDGDPIDDRQLKPLIRGYYSILSELKEEIMAKELAREQKLQEEEDGMVDEDVKGLLGE